MSVHDDNDGSPRRDAIIEFLRSWDQPWPPTVREIGAAVGLSSPSTVHKHLEILQDRGRIKVTCQSKYRRTLEVCE